MLMDANGRTERRDTTEVGSKNKNIIDAYGRNALNGNEELLLPFANNPDLALVFTSVMTPKGGV